MNNILVAKLKAKIKELKREDVGEDAIINALKEELQHYVLNFVYNSKEYSHLIMYGGSLLRIGYNLNRMSEDLDFQTDKKINTKMLARDIVDHFKKNYGQHVEISAPKRARNETKLLKIKFDILKEFGFRSTNWKVLWIRFDINNFKDANKFTTENIPITKDNLTFSIRTYPLSTLMASKILAVLNRTKRGIAGKDADCKPRDIFDLMWYMEKKIVPDVEYLKLKGEQFENLLELFEKIQFRVNNLSDNLFKKDLAPFFFDPSVEFDQWFVNWRQKLNNLINSYSLYKIGKFESGSITEDFLTDNKRFSYVFKAENKEETVRFTFKISDCWYFNDLKIEKGYRSDVAEKKLIFPEKKETLQELDLEYYGLFYDKVMSFLERSWWIVVQKKFATKLIRATADKIDPKKQIWLNKRLLEKVEFEELL